MNSSAENFWGLVSFGCIGTLLDLLRKRLLGKEGPYAEVRDATDQLDNVELWVSELNESQKSDLFHQLLSLMLDDHIEVATAAALSLDFVSKHIDCRAASAVLSENDSRLCRAPYRFSRISFGTIFEEYFARLSRCSPDLEPGRMEQVLRRNADP